MYRLLLTASEGRLVDLDMEFSITTSAEGLPCSGRGRATSLAKRALRKGLIYTEDPGEYRYWRLTRHGRAALTKP